MAKNKNTQTKKAVAQTKASAPTLAKSMNMFEKFAHIFVIGMFTVFPIYMTNLLFNVRKDRLHYFVFTTFALLFFILCTYICGIDKKNWPKDLFKMSVTDYAMIGFLVVCGLSAFLSKYGMESVTGEKGRNSGLLLMAMYVLCYFIISRYYRCKEYVFAIFAVTACIVCSIAILHEFYVDPFGILTDIKEEQQATFITTIGNKNLFSCFICVAMPAIVAMLIKSKDVALTVFYCIAAGISFMGLLVADSDSGYFGLAAFMLVLFVYSSGTADRMFKFFLSVLSILISCKVLRLISLIFSDNMKPLDTIPNTLIFSKIVYPIFAAVLVLCIVFYLLKRKLGDKRLPKYVMAAAASFSVLCVLAVVVPFVYFSWINTTADIGSLSKYLRMNDKWGTHRGYAWIRSIILFKTNGIKNMLIGSGPDTFGQIMKEFYYEDMKARHGSVFDSAHNEYLNYLVTIGLLGVAAYITALVSVVIRGAKCSKKSVAALVITVVIISYSAQALFNLAQPITTPYLFLFLAMGEAVIRKEKLESTNNQTKEKAVSKKP